jgi:acetyl esterase/lipase
MQTTGYCRRCLVFLFLGLIASFAPAQQTPIKLWLNDTHGAEGTSTAEIVRFTPQGDHVISNIQAPSITPYLPAPNSATGAAVIVAPGGGHSELWIDHEGYAVAEWLRDHGVAAFVLKYRLAREKNSKYTVEGTELSDIQRAVRTVRSRSKQWGINPEHIGVMGFSAGGELAALASTRYDEGSPAADDPIERSSSKPNFQALMYPAVPQDTRLTARTPPAFLACGANDRPDISQGLPELYLALSRLHVSAELHIYAGVGHGFGVRKTNSAPVSGWTTLFLQWMDAQGFLNPGKHE